MKKIKFFLLLTVVIFLFTSCVSIAGDILADYALKRKNSDGKDNATYKELNKTESKEDVIANSNILKEKMEKFLETAESEKWEITSEDNLKLVGRFIPCKDSHKYVILVHGYRSCKEFMLVFAPYFSQWGYNVLAIDNRAHGESEGKWIGMGYLDAYDQKRWINKIIEQDNDAEITLLGISMGGATVMMLSGLDLPENVKCIVEDCGYTSVWDEFTEVGEKTMKLKQDPWLYAMEKSAQKKAGYNFHEASSLIRLDNAKIPMLFIHGDEDKFVPFWMLDENISSYKGPYNDKLVATGAAHGESFFKDPEKYLNTVKSFLDKFIE